MNENADSSNSSVYYYDSDYPSPDFSTFPENFDAVTEYQGQAFDVSRYREIAAETGGPILELCCGTGRVAIPLARRAERDRDLLRQRFLQSEPLHSSFPTHIWCFSFTIFGKEYLVKVKNVQDETLNSPYTSKAPHAFGYASVNFDVNSKSVVMASC